MSILSSLTVVALGLIAIAALAYVNQARIRRLRFVMSLFKGKPQHAAFVQIKDVFPIRDMHCPAKAEPFPEQRDFGLPSDYAFAGKRVPMSQFLDETDTVALLILKDGVIRHESYRLTGGPDVVWPSFSLAKSVVSQLIGIAVRDGLIGSIQEPITKYVPKLKGSGYDGVLIKDILQMSSGARWSEDYGDWHSDVSRFGRIFALGGSLASATAAVPIERAAGSFNRYSSADTQALGMLLVAVTGKSIADYMAEHIVCPLGFEQTGSWIIDSDGVEVAFAGLLLTARDFAKLGELYRLNGNWRGRQIVPAEWVRASVTPDAAHLQPGRRMSSNSVAGYGYQWWIPEGKDGEYLAIGVYNQFIYVNPKTDVTIVKLSASRNYGNPNDESTWRELETVEAFRAISNKLSAD